MRERHAIDAVVPLVVVTVVVWGLRLRNLVADSEGAVAWTAAAAFLGLGIALGTLVLLVRRGLVAAPRWPAAVMVAAGVTVLWWVIRIADISVDAVQGDHSVPFLIVHAILGAAFVGTAGFAVRALVRRERPIVGTQQ